MTQKPKLEPGDRVRIVGPFAEEFGVPREQRLRYAHHPMEVEISQVRDTDVVGAFEERRSGAKTCIFHRRQVTHVLRPKQKPEKERVERWIYSNHGQFHEQAMSFAKKQMSVDGLVSHRFVLVKPGQVVLGREELARAWDKIAPSLGAWNRGSFFETMAESLGLGKK